MEGKSQPSPQPARIQDLFTFRQLIENSELKVPLVFKGIHRDWEPCLWSLDMWGKIIAKDDVQNGGLFCRVGQQNYQDTEPQWEAKTGQMNLTWHNLVHWSDEKRWVYYDYKNIVDVIDPKYFKKFEWKRLGFPEREGRLSNLWIGTKGSYTPCHFDTYGCNLVCQVYGRKSWLLFPPSDTPFLHASRIPYEESSVYSLINFCSPSVSHYKDLEKCHGVKVTLEPGDVLFVPPHWWHFVISDELSISVNTWIEQEHDEFARLQEAAIRFIIGSVVSLATPDCTIDILNPNEEDLTESSEEYLSLLLRRSYEDHLNSLERRKQKKSLLPLEKAANCSQEQNTNTVAISENGDGEPSTKKLKTNVDQFLASYTFIKKLSPYTFNFSSSTTNTNTTTTTTTSSLTSPRANGNGLHKSSIVPKQKHFNHLINAIGQPHILKQICEQFVKNVANDN